MKKVFASVATAAMLFGATAAKADTRPAATEFTSQASQESELEGESGDELLLIILALGGLLGILLAAGSSQGNSPR